MTITPNYQAPTGKISWYIYKINTDGSDTYTGESVVAHTHFSALSEASRLVRIPAERLKLYTQDSERVCNDSAVVKTTRVPTPKGKIKTAEVGTRTYSVRIELQVTERVERKATDVKKWISEAIDTALTASPFYVDPRVDIVGDVVVKEVHRKPLRMDE